MQGARLINRYVFGTAVGEGSEVDVKGVRSRLEDAGVHGAGRERKTEARSGGGGGKKAKKKEAGFSFASASPTTVHLAEWLRR